ncbi:MAG TPA: D-glycero-beta-D-manno-heptose 1-phosphate adenylyltransferase [Pyrinomonadaceae bacterium]|nr:D-glycero-beta-D-manno-heptose 1-phosphate adenylyltransferase [Pyrinomonadaceae bacterium]
MEKIVFTNGCFDIIHPGHIDLLERARKLGTKLIVGINSDRSVRAIKGKDRPFFSQTERELILQGLKSVDEVRIFDENTPENLIRELKPDVLVKGGDWRVEEIIGADFVIKNGGEVFSLPLKDGFSSSKIVEKIREISISGADSPRFGESLTHNSLNEHFEVFRKILAEDLENIENCAELIFETFRKGNKVLICGNGGSAADAQHIAAEFVGRYETERIALPAIALTTDTSALTALANDYDFERIFARQVEALAREADLLIAISTSGNSPNVISAVMKARQIGCKILGMTGAKGKKLASLCDKTVMAPSERTARIQEAHITIAHIWCEIIDEKIVKEKFNG